MSTPLHNPPLLAVRDLCVEFATRKGRGRVRFARSTCKWPRVRLWALSANRGSGKSVTSYAVMRILDRAGSHCFRWHRTVGRHAVARRAVKTMMSDLRGREISMIFQNPRAALNPIRTVGKQIEDVLIRHAQTSTMTSGQSQGH